MKSAENTDHRPVPLWVPVALTAGPVVALGFARFAYALILPAMVHNLRWSLATAGAMNTANALGYLFGALTTAPLANRWGLSRTFIVGLIVTSLTVLGTGLTSNNIALVLFRLASGAAGGMVFVAGGGLVAQATAEESSHRAALMLGIYFSGAGLGIVLSAWSIPVVLASLSPAVGWRMAWGILGSIGLLTVIGAVPAARRVVQPPGRERLERSRAAAPWMFHRLRSVLMAYGLYGMGYIIYMTFIIAFLQRHGARPAEIILFWTVLGGTALVSGFVWGRLLGRASGGQGVAVTMMLVLGGVLLPLWSTTAIMVLLSAILFGFAFLAVVTAVTAVARRNLPVEQWTGALAFLTVAFGLGQSIGPVLAGVMSPGLGGIQSGLVLSGGILALGAFVALTQRDNPARQPDHLVAPSEKS